MEQKTKDILVASGIILGSAIFGYVAIRLIRRKMSVVYVKGGYSVPANVPNRADALHSFERRKSDGFGGRMSTKIKEALQKMYKQGINPEVTELKVNVDSANYKVTWEAKLEPSKDGKAYIGIMTFGSAGSGADARALGQEKRIKEIVGGENYKLVLDFKNPKGIYIRQFFYQYTRDEFPPH
jgi:hypothetical protein